MEFRKAWGRAERCWWVVMGKLWLMVKAQGKLRLRVPGVEMTPVGESR